jgi:two-component system sensor histidine kinase RegB
MVPQLRHPHLTPRDHLSRLWVMRSIALFGQLTVISITEWGLHIRLPLGPIVATVSLLALFNAFTWLRLRRVQVVTSAEIFAQFWVDLIALSFLLYLTGGATNPFVSFYLPILAVAAAALPARYVWLLSGFSLAAYTLLAMTFVPLQVAHGMPLMTGPRDASGDSLATTYYLAGMWVNFVIGASWIAWFVLRMSRDLRERDAELASARQRLLQDARVVALAGQAARTAHELGTPLSSIAVAAGELSAAATNDPSLATYQAEINTIESQIEACRRALYGLREGTPQAPDDIVLLDQWLPTFFYNWRLAHPAIRLEVQSECGPVACSAAVLLGQVLTIILDNAARVSESVDLQARVAGATFEVTIDDRGPGLPEDLRESLGSAPVLSGSGGRGWGLFLAFTAAQARGGTIQLESGAERGTRVSIRWPLVAEANRLLDRTLTY